MDYALANGLMNGVGGGRFEPDGQLTRAQLVTVLYRAAGEPDTGKQVNPFTDVADDAWYTKAVIWAANNGIVNGVADANGTASLEPQATATRAQIATILMRWLEK